MLSVADLSVGTWSSVACSICTSKVTDVLRSPPQ